MKAILDRLFGLFRSAPVPPANDVEYDALDGMRSYIRRDVASGFYDRTQIVQNAKDAFDGELDADHLSREAAIATDQALAEHLAEQVHWPSVTDCDRLDAAFAELEAEGIVARQNFTCCGTCGAAEIWDEANALADAGKAVEGYTFYHMQDTESAADGDGLYLNYGAAEGTDDASVEIGHRIVDRLEGHGLKPQWDGSIRTRIQVPLEWKRRRREAASKAIH